MHRAERLRRAGTGWRWRSALWPALAVDNPAAHPAGGQPPCGRCRGLPTAAAAGTDALRWTSLRLAHAPVALLLKN